MAKKFHVYGVTPLVAPTLRLCTNRDICKKHETSQCLENIVKFLCILCVLVFPSKFIIHSFFVSLLGNIAQMYILIPTLIDKTPFMFGLHSI